MAAALRHLDLARVVTSPLRRARETALVLTAGNPVELDERLAEWQVPWVPQDAWPAALRPVLGGETPLPPEVEPLAAARARGLAALGDVATAASGAVALVSHGKLLALVIGALTATHPFDVFVTLENPHVLEVRAAGAPGERVRTLWLPAA